MERIKKRLGSAGKASHDVTPSQINETIIMEKNQSLLAGQPSKAESIASGKKQL